MRLTYDHFDQDMDGEALSSYSATVVGLTAHDEIQRDRVSLDWRFDDVLGLDSGSDRVLAGFDRAPVHL
ncbi:hypothetical protein NI454_12685 [Brevundimonas diminuta]|uniref:hypothetical protein n=1 Tax=Brevundimonas diminuta TaxID=293 RepID=UPI0020983061|nr:hypothetical protein [Brevundimonas diminuta]MCO8030803.1 hypothetical protein [Brevundimonas diminuta]